MDKATLYDYAKIFTLVLLITVATLLVLRNGESYDLFKALTISVVCYFFGERKGSQLVKCPECEKLKIQSN